MHSKPRVHSVVLRVGRSEVSCREYFRPGIQASKGSDLLTVVDTKALSVFLCLRQYCPSRPLDGRGNHQSKPIARYLPSPCL